MSAHEGSKYQEENEKRVKEILANPQKVFEKTEAQPVLKPKPFIVAEVRDLVNQVLKEKISFSRLVEILNEKAGHPTLGTFSSPHLKALSEILESFTEEEMKNRASFAETKENEVSANLRGQKWVIDMIKMQIDGFPVPEVKEKGESTK